MSQSKIPSGWRPFFWDCKFGDLDWSQDEDFITGRILAHGSWKAVKWLRGRLGDAGLKEWLERRQGAGLSPAQLRFWELILGLPHAQINSWLARPERKVWDQRRHS